MAKKIRIPRLELTPELLRTPECINCFDRIASHANGVLGLLEVRAAEVLSNFEIQSDELSEHFERKTDKAIIQIGTKTDDAIKAYLEEQGLKHDAAYAEHLEKQSGKQEEKYDNFEKKVLGLIKWVLGIVLLVAVALSAVVLYDNREIQNKAEKIELLKYLTIQNAREINDIREAYYKKLFIQNKNNPIDSTNYYWIISHYLSDPTRGESKFYRNDYMKQKNEDLLNK